MAEREFRVLVHEEDGSYWAEVAELPGCFASGQNLDELRDAITEAITLYVAGQEPSSERPGRTHGRIDEMRILVPTSS
jgi:predicted RNase H-like HicB family nuclease